MKWNKEVKNQSGEVKNQSREVKIYFESIRWKRVEPGIMRQLYSVCTELELPFRVKNSSALLKTLTISNLDKWIDCVKQTQCLECLWSHANFLDLFVWLLERWAILNCPCLWISYKKLDRGLLLFSWQRLPFLQLSWNTLCTEILSIWGNRMVSASEV